MSRTKANVRVPATIITHCSECPKGLTESGGVKHYQERHPEKLSQCFDKFKRTWLPQYDELAKAYIIELREKNAMKQKFESENAMRLTLAAKLNAIIMILEKRPDNV